MAGYDLKIALTLLLLVDSDENDVKRLIDSKQYYSRKIKSEDHIQLIEFVLKTRLSENAKSKVSKSYASVADLVKDLKTYLIQPKSYVAILDQLQRCKQGNRSIEEFGNEIDKLCNDLTTAKFP